MGDKCSSGSRLLLNALCFGPKVRVLLQRNKAYTWKFRTLTLGFESFGDPFQASIIRNYASRTTLPQSGDTWTLLDSTIIVLQKRLETVLSFLKSLFPRSFKLVKVYRFSSISVEFQNPTLKLDTFHFLIRSLPN